MTDLNNAVEEAKAQMLPYESWEKLAGESDEAFAAFCAFRDFGTDRNIRKAVESIVKNKVIQDKRYRVWRNYAAKFRWAERAADYDRYIAGLKQTEIRKTIEAQGEKHRQVTGKMLDVVIKKLDLMNPADLSQGTLTEWVQVAVKSEREAAGLIAPNGKTEAKSETSFQGEFSFVTDFQGL